MPAWRDPILRNAKEKKMKNRTLVIAILSAVLLGACSSPQAATEPAGPAEVHVTLREFSVEMDKTSIPAGPVVFTIENVGALTHELVLEKAGDDDAPFEANGVESEAEDIEPGATATIEWTIDEPGEYQVACHINDLGADHYDLGMLHTFTVTAK
jgi:uncharacterized cupredoxin-like copper-binding protein